MRREFRTPLLVSLGYLAVALLCMVQWGATDPWHRVDIYSGGYLGLRVLGVLHSLVSSRTAFESSHRRREWWGENLDPRWTKRVKFLMVADLFVFMDYGHWRIVPALATPALQGAGLILYLAVSLWQIWTDSRLATHFKEDEPDFMDSGPYRHIRHPRYAAAVMGKIAVALALASCLGWLLVAAWTAILLRQMALEEALLRRVFGARYDAYAKQTSRILPGIY